MRTSMKGIFQWRWIGSFEDGGVSNYVGFRNFLAFEAQEFMASIQDTQTRRNKWEKSF